MTIIFNDEWTACGTVVSTDHAVMMIDPFKSYGTEYGMFIPADYTGESWVRWIKAGMPDIDLETMKHYGSFVHITNNGEMYTVTFDANTGDIIQFQHTSKQFGTCSGSGKYFVTEAALIEKCETITQCLDILEERSIVPLSRPAVIHVNDWVNYAKEKGYNKHLFRTKWNTPK